MKIVGRGSSSLTVLVNTVVVYAKLYTRGKSKDACNAMASDMSDDILREYNGYFNNVKFHSVSMLCIRCVDESGIMSAEHMFSIRIEAVGDELLNSLRTLEEISKSHEDDFDLVGWESYVSKESLQNAVSENVKSAYEAALYEAKLLLPKDKSDKYDIEIVETFIRDESSGYSYIILPDHSNDDRAFIFNTLDSTFDLHAVIGREVVVTIYC